jgi:RNA recognition motif-containing protein
MHARSLRAAALTRREPERKEVIQTNLFVGNLSFDTTSEQLRELFGK